MTLALAGCAAQQAHRTGLEMVSLGLGTEGVESLRKATELDSSNLRYRVDYLRQRDTVVSDLLQRADDKLREGALEEAGALYLQVARIEAKNPRAGKGLARIETERRALAQLSMVDRHLEANQTESAAELMRRIAKEAPKHPQVLEMVARLEAQQQTERQARDAQQAARAAFRRPVTLSFRDTPLKMVFEAFTRAAGVNIIVDADVRSDLKSTIFLRDAAIEDAIDVILLQNKLEKRVLNSNTLLVYPATAAKQRELAELKVRAFRLSNVDAAGVGNTLKAMLKTRDLSTDTATNTLIMRDTPDAIALAEKIIAAVDMPDPEVMLEVAIMEVTSSRMTELGLKLPTSFSVSTPTAATTVGDLRALTGNALIASGLSATINLMLQDNDTNILASPRIRTRNKEKARILVGDKLPQITNLLAPQTGTTATVLTGSIQYVDVGIKLEVEPQVYADDDVGIRLNLEVSNVTDIVQTQTGRAYQLGTRSATTHLRLRDGETQVLGGLINDTDRMSAQKFPGLGQLPLLGRLFSNRSGTTAKTEILLSITPRIVRHVPIADNRNAEVWSGTESSVRDRPLRIDPIGTLNTNPASVNRAGAITALPAPATPPSATPSGSQSAPAAAPAPGVPAARSVELSAPPPTPAASTPLMPAGPPPSGYPVTMPRSVGPRGAAPVPQGTEPQPLPTAPAADESPDAKPQKPADPAAKPTPGEAADKP